MRRGHRRVAGPNDLTVGEVPVSVPDHEVVADVLKSGGDVPPRDVFRIIEVETRIVNDDLVPEGLEIGSLRAKAVPDASLIRRQ